jgi:hypothetical protein
MEKESNIECDANCAHINTSNHEPMWMVR